jgi:hypothetical protein
MVIEDLEKYAQKIGLAFDYLSAGEQAFLRLKGIRIRAGSHGGKECDVAIMRTAGTPWVPQAAVHVTPHLVAMGQRDSQGSPLGPEWQYLSRRFDHVPTPKTFMTHILTVVEEL